MGRSRFRSSFVFGRSSPIIRPNKNRPTSDLVKRPVSPAQQDKQSSTRPKARRLALLELFRTNVHCWLVTHSDGAEYSRLAGASQDLSKGEETGFGRKEE